MKRARIKISNLYKAQTELGDLSEDVLVWSFDGTAIKPARIKRDGVSDSGQKPVLELRLRDGSRIVATADHKIMTSRGWVQMADLDSEHLVMTATGFSSPCGMPTPAGTVPTFDITCEADPNFVANGIVVHNSGKGFIVALLARMYSGHRVLCVFNSVDLVLQTRGALVNKYGFGADEVGVIQGQNFQDDRRVTVMSVASYEKAFHIFPSQRVIIVDECHELASGTGSEMSTRVLYACQNAPVRIGLSATADAIDNPYRQMALYGNLGPIVYDEHIQDKVAEGTLADVDVEVYTVSGFAIPVTGSWADSYEEARIETKEQRKRAEKLGLEIVVKRGREYARRMIARGDESTHYVFNDRRNDLIARLALEHDRTVVLYTRREHGEQLLKRIEDGGGKAMLIGGLDDAKTREAAQNFLLEDERHIVLASNIWKKGTDVPWIRTLIIAGAGRGTAMVIQRFGRATRKHEGTGKSTAKVIDFDDRFSKMGAKQSARRMEIYRDKLGFKVRVIPC